MTTVIRFENVSYQYPGTKNWVLKDINFDIPKGSFFVLVGPSGSGKTTLLLLARGFAKEYGGKFKGNIFIEGRDISKKSIGELGSKVGLIFQNPALQLHQLRVIDEVMSAPMYQGLPYEECQKRAKDLIDKILGKEFYYRSPNELSSGEQQKVALAAALSMKADILLLDEPLSFLDTKADQEVLAIILRLHREGKTIIVATHDIEEVAKYMTHMALLDNGRLVLRGKPAKVLYSQKLEEVLTAPLSIKVAKALVKKTPRTVARQRPRLLRGGHMNPVSWEELITLKTPPRWPEGTPRMVEGEEKKLPKDKRTLLLMENISFRYPETTVGVKDVNLKIYQNEILGIIGANGSGKTTIAKLILGLLKPKNGKIRLVGKDITKFSTSERAKKIGYVTQDPMEMFFESNIWDEVAAGPKFLGFSNPKKRAGRTLKELNLWKYKNRHPDSISGGEKSLLGLADILANDPEILLLDEPEFGLDPKNWRKIASIIKDLREKGKTIIVITQDLEIVPFLCDRIVLMSNGKILKTDTSKQILTDFNLLKKAGLAVLPLFKLLNDVSDDALKSEEKFIEEISGLK